MSNGNMVRRVLIHTYTKKGNAQMTQKKIRKKKYYRKPRIRFNRTSQIEEFFPEIQINSGFRLDKLSSWRRQEC